MGVVLDFAQFRTLLWQQAEQVGVELLRGCRIALQRLSTQGADVWIHHPDGRCLEESVDLLVDATGSRRTLLRQAGIPIDSSRDPLLTGHGTEWILQADPDSSARWRDRLSCDRQPMGPAWLRVGFPDGRLPPKVGTAGCLRSQGRQLICRTSNGPPTTSSCV